MIKDEVIKVFYNGEMIAGKRSIQEAGGKMSQTIAYRSRKKLDPKIYGTAGGLQPVSNMESSAKTILLALIKEDIENENFLR